jgi:hypothetical protein
MTSRAIRCMDNPDSELTTTDKVCARGVPRVVRLGSS